MPLEERFWEWWNAELRRELIDGVVVNGSSVWTPAQLRPVIAQGLRHWNESWAKCRDNIVSGQWPENTRHSKTPKQPPEGYVMLAHPTWCSPWSQGPNFFYIRPEWVRSFDMERGHISWWTPQDKSNVNAGRSFSGICLESVETLAMAQGLRAIQPSLFGALV